MTSAAHGVDVPLRDWVDYHARLRPDAVALRCTDTGETRTWRELDDRVGRLARALLGTVGLHLGDRVAVLAENDVRTFETWFACMRAGLVFAPLNWRLELDELLTLVGDAGPAVLLHDHDCAAAASAVGTGAGVRTVVWGGPDDEYERLLASSEPLPGGPLDPDAIVQITYTSGTSGKPKGVTSANRTLVFHALNMAAASRVAEPAGHNLNVLPLFWGGGLNVFSAPILYWGGTVTTTRRFDEVETFRMLTSPSVAVTHICATPEIYQRMAELPDFDTAVFPTLRIVFTGGWRADTPQLHARWRERGVFMQIAYGSSETGPNLTIQQRADPHLVDGRSSGTLLPFSRLRIVDAEGGEVAAGESGEIWAAGPTITPGYWGRLRADHFTGEWFHTGDLGRIGEDGDLYIVGRVQEVIRSGGTNVFPAEIEQVLVEHPAVQEVAVIATADDRFGQVALAVVVPVEGARPTLDDLTDFCDGRLARYKRPRHLVLVDELPRNASQKVERHTLRARYATSAPAPGGA